MRDTRWWHGFSLVALHLERQFNAKIAELQLRQHFAMLDYRNDPTQLEHHWDQAIQLTDKLANTYMPWAASSRELAYKRLLTRMYDTYVEEFGRPGDAAHDAEVDKLLEYWESQRSTER